jgi:predicted acetyltransferase
VTEEPNEYHLRDATAADFDDIWRVVRLAFGVDGDDDWRDVERGVFEPERDHVITHGGEIVANAGAYTRELSVPGGLLPAAHVSFVCVEPTHHRRGLLRRLMTHQLRSVTEPVAVLWASEGRIYQRFGYGMATKSASLEINLREVALRASVEGEVRAAVLTEVRKELRDVYERKRALQPGLSSRDEHWWDRVTTDVPSRRQGWTAKRVVLFERGGAVEGYAIWRAKQSWGNTGPNGHTKVVELLATTPEAYAGLWKFLLSIDLARTVVAHPVGADDPLPYLVNEPSALGIRVGDGLWVRLVDLPRALTGRRYAAPLDVVIEVTDDLLPANAGRWRLRDTGSYAPETDSSTAGTGSCVPDSGEPDLACDIADLGAAYLGGTSLGQLALAGRVRELRPGAVAAASAAFSWHVPPTVIEIF